MANKINTLKVFFPGRRYSIDRSFLHFLDKYIDGESIYLDYSHKKYEECKLSINEETIANFNNCLDVLKKIDFQSYTEIIFIGKSIGTLIAGKIRETLKLENVRFICLTPITDTLAYLKQTDFILTSESDSLIDLSKLPLNSFSYPFLTVYKDIPHSLEYENNLYKTIDFLKTNLDLILNYLDTSYKDLLG